MANNGRSVFTPQNNSNKSQLKIYCDGRCKHYNDGPKAAWAFFVEDAVGNIKYEDNGFCENRIDATHIDAEYKAVIEGLRWAIAHGKGASIEVCTNLELIEQQVNGTCKIKTAKLLPLCNEVRALLEKAHATIHWIPKKKNKHAHRLSLTAYRIRGKE